MLKRIFVLIVVAMCCLSGCSDAAKPANSQTKAPEQGPKTNWDKMATYGLTGAVPIHRTVKKTDDGKSIVSPYFSASDKNNINFLIETKQGEIIPFDLHHSLYRVIKDASKKTPTVEIEFDKNWRQTSWAVYQTYWEKGPAAFAENSYISTVTVRISPSDLEKEMAFPY